jgi:Fe-S-cluster containining protein
VTDVPECLVCAACCFSELEDYVRVTGDDYERLGEAAASLVRFDGFRAYLRMIDGHCAALVAEPASGRLVCSAYTSRPEICRELARGSPHCAAEREAKSQRPVLALLRARS